MMRIVYVMLALAAFSLGAPRTATAQNILGGDQQQIGTVVVSPIHAQSLSQENLYRVDIGKCRLLPIQSQTGFFVNPQITAVGVVTFSIAPISSNETPPSSSILAAIPFDDRLVSDNNEKKLRNETCVQSFLVNGHNDLYMTVTYSELKSNKPSKLLSIVANLAGVAKPLLNVVPGGAAAGPFLDAVNGAASPYSSLLSAFDEEGAHTVAVRLGPENYTITASTATLSISVRKITSVLQSGTVPILNAFEQKVQDLTKEISAKQDCVVQARELAGIENYSRSDIVYALSKASVDSGLALQKMEACLTRDYGPEVSKTPYWIKNVDAEVSDDDFPPRFDRLAAYDRARADDVLEQLNKSGAGASADLASVFEASVILKDRTGLVTASVSKPEDLVGTLRDLGFTRYGCPYDPKDEAYHDAKQRLASAFVLAMKTPPIAGGAASHLKLTDALLLTLWWEGDAAAPKIFEAQVSNPGDMLRKVVAKWSDECAPDEHFDVPKPQ